MDGGWQWRKSGWNSGDPRADPEGWWGEEWCMRKGSTPPHPTGGEDWGGS